MRSPENYDCNKCGIKIPNYRESKSTTTSTTISCTWYEPTFGADLCESCTNLLRGWLSEKPKGVEGCSTCHGTGKYIGEFSTTTPCPDCGTSYWTASLSTNEEFYKPKKSSWRVFGGLLVAYIVVFGFMVIVDSIIEWFKV